MKKLMKVIFAIVACVGFAFCGVLAPRSSASAVSVTNYSAFTSDVNMILSNYVTFTNRMAGSEGEKNAADYIKTYLKTNTTLTPKDNAYIFDGVQEFTFKSDFSDLNLKSQNIIFEYNPAIQSDKKVIIACNYDSVAFEIADDGYNFEFIDSEGLNVSAGSVATLLAIAKHLPYQSIDFNIEFVFFGAGESSNAGSKIYTQGISEKDKENILCMFNLDSIALGEKLYFYENEISSKFGDFVSNVAKENSIAIKQVNTSHLSKMIEEEANVLGLNYKHIALASDNINFMKLGITSINLFAGDYDEGIVVGRSEFAGKEVVSYTKNDNIVYVTDNFGFEKVNENLYEVYKGISAILTDIDFQTVAVGSIESNNWFYMVFGNEKLVVYLTVIAFVLFVVIAMYVHYKLSVKAYYANVEMEFLSSVVKISEQIDTTGVDANVPKVISQVLAHDIKKDKTIKSKKVKKNKDK